MVFTYGGGIDLSLLNLFGEVYHYLRPAKQKPSVRSRVPAYRQAGVFRVQLKKKRRGYRIFGKWRIANS
jgi:hypothetical protein